MKKIIISIATISVFIFTSCFTDSDTATVKINLGNIPLAKVEKKSIIDRFVALFLKEAIAQDIPLVPEGTDVNRVHLGAFDANNQLLAKRSIKVEQGSDDSINTVVEFDVPAGVRRKIVVLGEKTAPEGEGDDFINYYGVSDEIELIAGENKEVPIDMMDIDKYEEFQDHLNLQDGKQTGDEAESKPATWNHIVGASQYNIYTGSPFPIEVTENKYLHYSSGPVDFRIYFDFAKIESNDIYLYFASE